MAVLVDPPRWPAHGRLWSHLVSDTSLAELHAVAGAAGVPRRGFSGDHYDVPAEMLGAVVAAGAVPVAARDLLRALQASGLRVPKRRGETLLGSWPAGEPAGDGEPGAVAVDLLASPLAVPDAAAGAWIVFRDRHGRVLLAGGRALPGGRVTPGEPPAAAAVRALAESGGPRLHPAALSACGYLRVRPAAGTAGTTGWRWAPYLTAAAPPGSHDDGPGAVPGLEWVAVEHLPAVAADRPPAPPRPWPLVRHVLAGGHGG